MIASVWKGRKFTCQIRDGCLSLDWIKGDKSLKKADNVKKKAEIRYSAEESQLWYDYKIDKLKQEKKKTEEKKRSACLNDTYIVWDCYYSGYLTGAMMFCCL